MNPWTYETMNTWTHETQCNLGCRPRRSTLRWLDYTHTHTHTHTHHTHTQCHTRTHARTHTVSHTHTQDPQELRVDQTKPGEQSDALGLLRLNDTSKDQIATLLWTPHATSKKHCVSVIEASSLSVDQIACHVQTEQYESWNKNTREEYRHEAALFLAGSPTHERTKQLA